jgi:hypothetical protein
MGARARRTASVWSAVALVSLVAVALAGLASRGTAQAPAVEDGRFDTQAVTDGAAFWVYATDTATGATWFLDRQDDGPWEWVDYGPAPNGPGPSGRYQLSALVSDGDAGVYVSDTTTGELWVIDKEAHQWLTRGTPAGAAGDGSQDMEPGRYRTRVVTDDPTFWVYSIDTTTGQTWFLAGRHGDTWEWSDNGPAPDGPGPVGRYQLVAFASKGAAHVYASDTTTGRLWRIDEAKREWLPRGVPEPSQPQ